jgi:protein-L-isoaspartate(D-aspartate) O-methyltransferase
MRGAPGPLLAAPGGRFVMPLGVDRWTQRLICRTRTGPDAYVEEEFEWVAFVPLVGAHGWPADTTSGARRFPEP